MKIYDQNLTSTSAADTGRAQQAQNLSRAGTDNSSARAVADVSTDRVEFSGTMSRLSRALGNSETTRADRVQSLTAQYQSGKYQPDPAAISKGLVTETLSAGLQ